MSTSQSQPFPLSDYSTYIPDIQVVTGDHVEIEDETNRTSIDEEQYTLTRIGNYNFDRVTFVTPTDPPVIIRTSILATILTSLLLILYTVIITPSWGYLIKNFTVVFSVFSNYRTIVSYLLMLWFFAYHGLSWLIWVNVERVEENRANGERERALKGEIDYNSLHKWIGEWRIRCVRMPGMEAANSVDQDKAPTESVRRRPGNGKGMMAVDSGVDVFSIREEEKTNGVERGELYIAVRDWEEHKMGRAGTLR